MTSKLNDENKSSDPTALPDADVKVILLGDSAVGKSKLVERFLMDEYSPRQVSFIDILFEFTVNIV